MSYLGFLAVDAINFAEDVFLSLSVIVSSGLHNIGRKHFVCCTFFLVGLTIHSLSLRYFSYRGRIKLLMFFVGFVLGDQFNKYFLIKLFRGIDFLEIHP